MFSGYGLRRVRRLFKNNVNLGVCAYVLIIVKREQPCDNLKCKYSFGVTRKYRNEYKGKNKFVRREKAHIETIKKAYSVTLLFFAAICPKNMPVYTIYYKMVVVSRMILIAKVNH